MVGFGCNLKKWRKNAFIISQFILNNLCEWGSEITQRIIIREECGSNKGENTLEGKENNETSTSHHQTL